MNYLFIIVFTVYIITIECLNIETYLDFWCKEPLKMIDFQPFLTDDYYRKEAEYKCGLWFRHIPNKNWTSNLTNLFSDLFMPQLSILKVSDGLEEVDEKLFSLEVKLRFLDLSGNNLTHLKFTEKKSNISSYSLNILDYLQGLDLSNNSFTNITFIKTNATFLQVLDLSHNELETVPMASLQYFPRLYKLILKKNVITEFEKGLFKYPNLENLDISSNRLKNLNGLESFVNLRVLCLSYNIFPVLSPGLFNSEIWSLEELKLDHNEIEEITSGAFRNFPNLKKLKLGYNRISNLEPDVFLNLKRLESLDISHNSLTEIDGVLFVSQKRLFELNFRKNLVEKFDYVGIITRTPSLREIDLLENSFYCDEFDEMLLFLEEKAIDVIGEEDCNFNENRFKNCCKRVDFISSTSTENHYGAEKISRKLTTERIDNLQLMLNRTSHNISQYIENMEVKSDAFFKLVLCQFGFIIIFSSIILLVLLCRQCTRKNRSIQTKIEAEKII